MRSRTLAAFVAVALLTAQAWPAAAWADNQMGYRLLSQQEAAGLPRNQGAIGLNVERAQQITDGGMTFDIIRVTQVRPGSAGERAGLKRGDQIIALDGRVFPTLVAFASYVGSARPGSQMTVDFMPAGGGPQQAQRVSLVVGRAGQASSSQQDNKAQASGGLSTGQKMAIGAGAVALLGCYKVGCFSHRAKSADASQQGQPADGYQQR